MNSFVDDLKKEWHKPNNTLMWLLLVNVFVFIFMNLAMVITKVATVKWIYKIIRENMFVAPDFVQKFIYKPWTALTYAFTHEAFLHFFSNMMMLYWFGRIIVEYLNVKRLFALYIWGAFGGAFLYLFANNLIDFILPISFFEPNKDSIGMLGASASVYAIVVCAGKLYPEMLVHLLFFQEVKLKYVAFFTVFLSFVGSFGYDSGGDMAHLGGALVGYLFAVQYRKGSDWSVPVTRFVNWFTGLFKKKAKVKMGYRNPNSNAGKTQATRSNQDELDRILDKISQSGYENLSKEEKQFLFKESQRK
ncbi:MAG: rhomboid family intramembrane serine protease [Bacteroidetes bacterium]|nr:MAG: rhomboid family intramembrane serine protease [Bacteroidota bacterium]